jgi:methylene-fatty-acyl-phospholipid synthase
VAQFAVVCLWYTSYYGGVDLSKVPALHALLGLGLVGAGQTLNVSIYQAIGEDGVYYGNKLGHKVPWHRGWPFNVVSHPQYVGSILSILGAVILFWNQSPAGTAILAAYWCALYGLTALVEEYF